MRTHSKSLVLVVGALALAAGCGSDDDADTTPATDAPVSTDAPDTTDAPATDAPDTTDAPDATDAPDGDGAACSPDGPRIVIGAQDFGESAILAEVYAQALAAGGCDVGQQALGGFRDIVFTAFGSGDINFTPEYAASALEFLNDQAGEATGDIDETMGFLQDRLAERDLVALAASPAVDSNSFVVTQETADELGLTAVSDLTDDLRLGGPPDCPDNASCIPGLQSVYGVDLSSGFTPLDGGGPLTVAALDGGEIDVAILFSTSGVIADRGWVVLDDDQQLINADNVVPVTTASVVDAHGDGFAALVDAVSAALDTDQLTELNRRYDIDLEDADVVAADWLREAGFLD